MYIDLGPVFEALRSQGPPQTATDDQRGLSTKLSFVCVEQSSRHPRHLHVLDVRISNISSERECSLQCDTRKIRNTYKQTATRANAREIDRDVDQKTFDRKNLKPSPHTMVFMILVCVAANSV